MAIRTVLRMVAVLAVSAVVALTFTRVATAPPKPAASAQYTPIVYIKPYIPYQPPPPVIYEITAYTANHESTGKRRGDVGYGITSSGHHVKPNFTLACPPELPTGTRIFIPWFDRTFTCDDTGSAITAGHLDVYMTTVHAARQFGRRNLPVNIRIENSIMGDE